MDLPVRSPHAFALLRRACSLLCALESHSTLLSSRRHSLVYLLSTSLTHGSAAALGNSYFMIYLWKKAIDDQTGFESYVFFRLNELLPDGQPQHKRAPDVSWFPNNEAMAIPDLRDANTDFLLSMRLDVLSDAAQVFPPLTIPSKLSCLRRRVFAYLARCFARCLTCLRGLSTWL